MPLMIALLIACARSPAEENLAELCVIAEQVAADDDIAPENRGYAVWGRFSEQNDAPASDAFDAIPPRRPDEWYPLLTEYAEDRDLEEWECPAFERIAAQTEVELTAR